MSWIQNSPKLEPRNTEKQGKSDRMRTFESETKLDQIFDWMRVVCSRDQLWHGNRFYLLEKLLENEFKNSIGNFNLRTTSWVIESSGLPKTKSPATGRSSSLRPTMTMMAQKCANEEGNN